MTFNCYYYFFSFVISELVYTQLQIPFCTKEEIKAHDLLKSGFKLPQVPEVVQQGLILELFLIFFF